MKKQQLDYGTIKVLSGKYKGRIGYYDNDSDSERSAIVYFGNPVYSEYYFIPHRHIAPATIPDLINRYNEIISLLANETKLTMAKRANPLAELSLI